MSLPRTRRSFFRQAISLPAWPLLAAAETAVPRATLEHTPYLQDVGLNRATVIWAALGDGVQPLAIEYSSDPQFSHFTTVFGGRSAVPGQPFTQFRAAIGGLAASTRYYYRLAGDAANAPWTFRTASHSGPMKFLALGDSGVLSEEQTRLRKLMEAEDASLVLHTGDLAYPDADYVSLSRNYLQPFARVMAQTPFFPCAGNHDVDMDGGAAFRAYHALPGSRTGDPQSALYYSFDWGDVHFTAIDSNTIGDPEAAGRMIEWVEKDLAASSKPWRVVYWHHAPFDVARGLEPLPKKCRESLIPFMERHGVQLVLAGHNHSYQRTKALSGNEAVAPGRGITYITTGGGGAGLYEAPVDELSAVSNIIHHYLSVEVAGSQMRVRAIGVDGREIDNFLLRPLPVLSRNSVVNAASYFPAVAPGALVSIFGGSLAFEERKANGAALRALNGTEVTLDGQTLPLFFISPGQINTQLPFDTPAGSHTLIVANANGVTSTTITVADAAPGIFSAARLDGSPISAQAAANPGEVVKILATGLGRVHGNPEAGKPAAADFPVALLVELLVGQTAVPTISANLVSGLAGIYEVVAALPPDLAPGLLQVRLTSNGQRSNHFSVFVR